MNIPSMYGPSPDRALDYEEHNRVRLALRELLDAIPSGLTDELYYLGGIYITTPPIPVWESYATTFRLLPRHTRGSSDE